MSDIGLQLWVSLMHRRSCAEGHAHTGCDWVDLTFSSQALEKPYSKSIKVETLSKHPISSRLGVAREAFPLNVSITLRKGEQQQRSDFGLQINPLPNKNQCTASITLECTGFTICGKTLEVLH